MGAKRRYAARQRPPAKLAAPAVKMAEPRCRYCGQTVPPKLFARHTADCMKLAASFQLMQWLARKLHKAKVGPSQQEYSLFREQLVERQREATLSAVSLLHRFGEWREALAQAKLAAGSDEYYRHQRQVRLEKNDPLLKQIGQELEASRRAQRAASLWGADLPHREKVITYYHWGEHRWMVDQTVYELV